MRAVEIHVPNGRSLPDAMAEMRQWLDHHDIAPTRCLLDQGRLLIRIEFSSAAEANEFAKGFDGIVQPERISPFERSQVGLQPRYKLQTRE